MPRGSKDAYTDKQKRKAEHIEQSYEDKGVAPREAEARQAAATRQGAPRPGQSLEDSTRADLMMRARDLGIAGRSRMRKAELIQAIRHAA